MESKQVNYSSKLQKIVARELKKSDFNLYQVSKLTGIDHGGLWRYVNQPKKRSLNFETAYKLISFFDIDLDELEQ